jgi:V8-like Glu-specific endopeptidase
MMVLWVLDLLFKAQAMVPTSNLIFAVIILMFSVVAPATAGPLEDAVAATHKGDYAAAHEFLRPLADNGDIRAQFNLGQLYANGWGVRRDYAEAVAWYRKAADQGLATAQYNLGVAYANGDGVLQDDAEAVRWYRLAADQGYPAAQFNLGIAYANGWGVPRDLINAYMWVNLSVMRGIQNPAAAITAAKSLKTIAQEKMTPAQIAEAQKLARDWKPKLEPQAAADRQAIKQLLDGDQYYGDFADPSVWPISAVGLVTIALSSTVKSTCTGTLVAPNLVLTNAHCLFHSRQLVQPGAVRFAAGWNRGVPADFSVAGRLIVSKGFAPGPWEERMTISKEFSPGHWDAEVVANDWALIVLKHALSTKPISVKAITRDQFSMMSNAGSVQQIGYALERKYVPSIVRDCRVSEGPYRGTFIYRCLANWGYSGEPIIAEVDGTPSVIGIGTSMYKGRGLACSATQFENTVIELTQSE